MQDPVGDPCERDNVMRRVPFPTAAHVYTGGGAGAGARGRAGAQARGCGCGDGRVLRVGWRQAEASALSRSGVVDIVLDCELREPHIRQIAGSRHASNIMRLEGVSGMSPSPGTGAKASPQGSFREALEHLAALHESELRKAVAASASTREKELWGHGVRGIRAVGSGRLSKISRLILTRAAACIVTTTVSRPLRDQIQRQKD